MRQGLRPNLPKGLIRAVAQQATARPRPGMHLIFDFDGTITERDTIGELVRSAIAWQRGRGRDGRELQAAWDSAVRAYADEHHDYATRYAPPQDERTTVGDEAAYLAGMRPSEERSLDRVGQTGVFAGMTAGDLFRLGAEAVGAGHIRIRRGFAEALALAAQRGWRTDVVSVNWSRDFIRTHPAASPVVPRPRHHVGGQASRRAGPDGWPRRRRALLWRLADRSRVPAVRTRNRRGGGQGRVPPSSGSGPRHGRASPQRRGVVAHKVCSWLGTRFSTSPEQRHPRP
ncbi:hypothetical protein HIM_07998 [Hirsutella minnesotensis 3608]|uniref:Uncharacterized protein n=1 Tax=Hirsutella minnesotensis 3608 TaxID=1043627 RepID=A0A0F8A3Y5_9HYPO|nr:hypothetical protein HIM_07998 [Hirsutella minnesotensis 3608]